MTNKEAEEIVRNVFRELNLECAYDMPSFRCNEGKDYKVIPTKWHQGYLKALEDAEDRIMKRIKETDK